MTPAITPASTAPTTDNYPLKAPAVILPTAPSTKPAQITSFFNRIPNPLSARADSSSPVRSLRTTLPIIQSPKPDATRRTQPLETLPIARISLQELTASADDADNQSSDLSDVDIEMAEAESLETFTASRSSPKSPLTTQPKDPFASSPLTSPSPTLTRQPFPKTQVIAASDDEDSDSSFDFQPIRLVNTTTPAKTIVSSPPSTRAKRPITTTGLRNGPAKKARLTFEDLIESGWEDRDIQDSLKRADDARKEVEDKAQGMNMGEDADSMDKLKGVLQDVIADREDGVGIDKVVRAVERTDVSTDGNVVWFSFGDAISAPSQPYPSQDLKSVMTAGNSNLARNQAANFHLDFLILNPTAGADTLTWLLENGCFEVSRQREFLNALSSLSQTVDTLSIDRLLAPLRVLGANSELFDHNKEVVVSRVSRSLQYVGRRWLGLQFWLDAVGCLAKFMTTQQRSEILLVLLKFASDAELMTISAVRRSYSSALRSIVPAPLSTASISQISTTLRQTLSSSSLLATLVRSMPINTKALRLLRLHLATSFLPLPQQDTHVLTLSAATALLDTPLFQFTKNTDYLHIRSLIMILDVALAAPTPPTDADTANPNGPLDDLISTLKRVSRSINDVNMGSMHPAEAKGAVDVLLDRLTHAVRVGGAERLDIFGAGVYKDGSRRKLQSLIKRGEREKGQSTLMDFAVKKSTAIPATISS